MPRPIEILDKGSVAHAISRVNMPLESLYAIKEIRPFTSSIRV